MKAFRIFTLVFVLSLVACGPIIPESGATTAIVSTSAAITVLPETPGPSPTEGPSPTPAPPTLLPTLSAAALSPTELKYRVMEQFPDFFYCDPDLYPIARGDERALALGGFPQLQADQEEFQAILRHNSISENSNFTDAQKLLIYREHKKLNAIHFELVGDAYRFQIQTGTEGTQGSLVTGTIDGQASIEIEKQEPGFPSCPICLAAGTLIDTPQGYVAVEDLRPGDLVWTLDESGERLSEMILRTSRVPVPASHQVLHVILSDGRELWASPGHPTIDRQRLADLNPGDLLDGAQIVLLERLPYQGTETYDLLPSGETGFYWANGILMGSTLEKP